MKEKAASQTKGAACAKARQREKAGGAQHDTAFARPGLQDQSGRQTLMDPLTLKICMNPVSLAHSFVAPGVFKNSSPQ